MSAVANQTTTYNLENYVGELFSLTPSDTKFLSMIGGLTGGEGNDAKQDTWQTEDNNTPDQDVSVEGADPTYESRDRTEVSNIKQIVQYGVEVSYTKRAATGNVAAAATPVLGMQPVQDELDHQIQLKIKRAARAVNYSMLQGTYQAPANNSTPRKMRGLKNAITTNNTAAGGAVLTKAHIDNVLKEMADSGAPFTNPVLFANSFNRQQVSNAYGYAPDSRTVGGVAIERLLTDFCELGVAYDRDMPTDEVYIVDVAYCTPTFLTIPEKGHFFVEPLAHTGASWKYQLYGEIGLKYGPERWHGSITGTATSA